MVKESTIKPDVLGALASGLCMLHCIATPLLFVVQSCSTQSSCRSESPLWWSSIDYFFIGVTFFAIYHASKHSVKPWMGSVLFLAWAVLSLLVINEKFVLLLVPVWCKYLAAFTMISLHLYNLKYGKCDDESCCVV